ncbi:MAG: heparan-alpha-glucosaminide N-acetyltransferase domain-containing protein [Candidatus Izemoplasmatales bacterium]|jgi:uncharacterized membrane protein|nr:heparan-alpha-glucosaminide N-acetyltransferase domain-containing protein [Candidatus Izemoplasmatales bacterium]
MDKKSKNRVWELDFLRGFAIIMMVFDHLLYDLASMPAWFSNYTAINNEAMQSVVRFGQDYWASGLRGIGHHVFIAIFLLVSGISFTFSRSNWKRGVKFLAVALAISGTTILIEAISNLNIGIYFGIIHMFASSILIIALLRKIWNNDIFILILGASVIILGLSFEYYHLASLEELSIANFWELIVGTKSYGADSFGIVPYVGIIMLGTVIGNVFYKNRVSLLPQLDGKWHGVFSFTGRHSFLIFLLHQIVIFGLVILLGTILGYRF